MTLDVLDGVIYNLMNELRVQSLIRFKGVRKDFGSRFDMFLNVCLKGLLSAAISNKGTDLAATLEDPYNHCLVFAASPGDLLFPNVLVHVPCLLTYEGLVNLNPSSGFFKGAFLHRKADALKHEPCCLLGDANATMEFP